MAYRGVHNTPYEGVLDFGRHLITWWPFIYGRYRLNGIDLRNLFDELDGEESFDLIDSIIIDEMLYKADYPNDGVEKVRTAILSVYNDVKKHGRSNDAVGGAIASRSPQPIQYTNQTEEGYQGLEPPMG